MAFRKLMQPSLLPCGTVILPFCGYPAPIRPVYFRPVHTCQPLPAGQKWRMRQGKSRSGNEYGPLTDLPDWTYTDGRPPVVGKGQLKRKVKQFELSQRVRKLLDEMDLAKGKANTSKEPAVGEDNNKLAQGDESDSLNAAEDKPHEELEAHAQATHSK